LKLAKGARGKARRSPFASIEDAVAAIRAGQMIIVVDDEDRENEGDLHDGRVEGDARGDQLHGQHGRGLLCLAMTPERLDRLEIPLEVADNSSRGDTAMCVSIDAKAGTTTGIPRRTARDDQDRDRPDTTPRDLARPGHVFPLRARPGGVMVRAGHTEGAVDLARTPGCSKPA
jgi:3,4-dihydroxy 2-butanone 4-phosphate synthase/GTP cyclohydrolase II